MGVQDDFGLWEREITGADEASDTKGMLPVAILAALACTGLIMLGEMPLAIAGIAMSSIILILWRLGL